MTEQGGPWTSHGHPVAGLTVYGEGRPRLMRCGGPRRCKVCAAEAAALRQEAEA